MYVICTHAQLIFLKGRHVDICAYAKTVFFCPSFQNFGARNDYIMVISYAWSFVKSCKTQNI